MARQYVDAWAERAGGSGATHSGDGHEYRSRIDYLFSNGLDVNAASVPAVAVSVHRPVAATYMVPRGTTAASDKWPGLIVSGMDARDLRIAYEAGAITIGPLRQRSSGFHYNGPSTHPFDLSIGGYGQVQLLHGVVGDQANAMFTGRQRQHEFLPHLPDRHRRCAAYSRREKD